MKQIREHTWEVTEPTPIQIGKPVTPPSSVILDAIRIAVSKTGATSVYWFWVSVSGDQPHLGLAVAPDDVELADRIGQVVAPIWEAYSPDNSACDVFRFGNPELDAIILREGEPLCSQNA